MDIYALYARWLRGENHVRFMPWQIDIDTTNRCNQSCYYCNSADFRSRAPVSQDLAAYARLIEQLVGWRSHDPQVIGTLSNVIFSGGGEPTLLPGWEKLVELCVDAGYLVAMNTNGARLETLLKVAPEKLRRLAYIGLDIDSGSPDTYERIRRSRQATSPFEKIKRTASELGSMGLNLDVKALLMPENTSAEELRSLFEYAKAVRARSIHVRPMVLDGQAFPITGDVFETIRQLEATFGVQAFVALGRYEPRRYRRCHQFFLFPSFSADGRIYLCCEYKGREDLCLGSWCDASVDWRDAWCAERHREIYANFSTALCKPCRPNNTNNRIEEALQTKPNGTEFI